MGSAARAIRCAVFSELALKHWGLLVENIGKGDTDIFNPPTFPSRRKDHRGWRSRTSRALPGAD